MADHTPGPWLVMSGAYEDRFTEIVTEPGGPLIARVFTDDARLIAAAPDLLAALERIAAGTLDLPDSFHVQQIARAAIAKAKGLEP